MLKLFAAFLKELCSFEAGQSLFETLFFKSLSQQVSNPFKFLF